MRLRSRSVMSGHSARVAVQRPAAWLSVVTLLAGAAAASVTISPGERDRATAAPTVCPTFSWVPSASAAGYELVVLDLARPEAPAVALRRRVVGRGESWTPSREECLAPGGSYAWTLRPLDAAGLTIGGESSWAAPLRFVVPAAPHGVDVAAALEVVRRWQAAGGGAPPRPPRAGATPRAPAVSGTAAVRGENPATVGTNFGAWGQSASPAGAGLAAVNLALGPDLILDGAAQGQVDTHLSNSGLDRPSASPQSFTIQNSGVGTMTVLVDGSPVSLEGHLHAGEEITSGLIAEPRLAASIARDSEVLPLVLAADGPGSELDADLLDGLQATSYQRRITGTCPPGSSMQAILADGSVVCYEVAVPPEISLVDNPAESVGQYTDIAIGLEGFPVVSYYDATRGALKVLACNDPACDDADDTITTVDLSAGHDVGRYTSIAVGPEGLPVISYQDATAGTLRVAKCQTTTCTAFTIATVDDPGNSVGRFTSLAIGADGLPVISYYDETAAALKVAKCNDAACAGGNETVTTVDDPAGTVGLYTSLAIGADGRPVISYYDLSAEALRVVKCNDLACAPGGETITTVDDPPNHVGRASSLAIGTDGFPVISYRDATAAALKVVKCNDPACAPGGETITTVDDPANAVGEYTALAVGADGFPVIAYYDTTAGKLKVAKCNDAGCAPGGETIARVDLTTGDIGSHPAIILGADGLPVISYYAAVAGGHLRVAKCRNASCQE